MTIMVELVDVTDGFLADKDIEKSFRRVHPIWYRGPYGMRSENLKIWLAVAQAYENPDPPRW